MRGIVNFIRNLRKKKSGSQDRGDDMLLNFKKVYLSGSILNLKPIEIHSNLLEIDDLIDYIHVDVMDGVFVPNKTNGIEMFKEISRYEKKPFDVHLMVEEPQSVICNFSGASIITFHIETIINDVTMAIDLEKFNQIVKEIRDLGAKVGVAIKPNTTESLLRLIISKVDVVLVMTVEPGYGGQKLIPHTLNKIENIRKMGFKGLIEVDGGITTENAEMVRNLGVNMIVAGTALFGAEDIREAAKLIKGI